MTLLTTLMWECNLEKVNRVQCMEGMVPLWEEGLPERLGDLRCLLLNSCGLVTIPPGLLLQSSAWERGGGGFRCCRRQTVVLCTESILQ